MTERAGLDVDHGMRSRRKESQPLVLRVELGSVSLPARQWALLRKGDILETGQPLGSEVTLRVAGKAIAQGELLNVEGELGVRITKLLVGEEQ